jgi:hypothetical protein
MVSVIDTVVRDSTRNGDAPQLYARSARMAHGEPTGSAPLIGLRGG